ncbi:MAG TPA: ABC transporter permease [Vicinamibacterales bacterium]|nr:ABC transporter permease [Vicinamibacterales bacterium]
MRADLIALWRRWRARPGLPALALLVLTIGVGAGATVLGATYAALLRPLPYPRADQLVVVQADFPGMKLRGMGLSGPEASELAGFARSFAASGFGYVSTALVDIDGVPLRADVARVSAGLLDALRATPAQGQTFTTADDAPAGPCRIVISRQFGDDALGGAVSALGRTVRIAGDTCEIVGVWPRRVLFLGTPADIWAPLHYDIKAPTSNRANHSFTVIARMSDDVPLEAARADIARAVEGWASATGQFHSPSPKFHPLSLTPMVDLVRGPVRGTAWVLLLSVATVLVVTIANASALLVADADHRRSEMLIRAALGADRRRLWRMQAADAVVLGALAAGLGAAAALSGARVIAALAPPVLAHLDVTLPAWQTAAAAAGVAAIAAIVCSLLQASRIPWGSLAGALGGDSRSGTATPSRQRLRRALVAVEVALAVALVAGSALMVESVWRLVHIDLGFRPEGVVRAQINLPADRYDTRARIDAFYDAVTAALHQQPGVSAAGAVTGLLPERRPNNTSIVISGATGDPHLGTPPIQFMQFLTPEAFPALGLTLRRGRLLTAADRAAAQPVVVINERAAQVYFANRDALGGQLRLMGTQLPWLTVVGVVDDARQNGVVRDAGTELFVPLAQAEGAMGRVNFTRDLNLVVRLADDRTGAFGPILRAAVRGVDPAAAVSEVEAMTAVVARGIAGPRFLMMVIGGFAVVSLLLAAVGVYGIVAHTVTLRTREIGVRRSLGASGGAISALIARQVMALVTGGLVVGLTLAVSSARLLAPFAFQTELAHPARLAAIAASMVLIALLSSARPLVRALRVDPAVVLKQ